MISNPLGNAHRTRCHECGATVWRYPTAKGRHRGEHVLLEDAPGGYSIREGEALRATQGAGYRLHQHSQVPQLTDLRIAGINEGEFLWI